VRLQVVLSNNPMMRLTQRPGPRRAVMLVLLAIEVAVIAAVIWFATSLTVPLGNGRATTHDHAMRRSRCDCLRSRPCWS
jgi:hypothetical protein